MQAVKDMLNKIPYIGVVAVYLIYLGYSYFDYVSSDPTSPVSIKKAELKNTEEQLAKVEKRVKEAQIFFQNLEKKKESIRVMTDELASLKGTLSEDLDVPSFIKTIVTEAKRVGLRVKSLKPLLETKKPLYFERKFAMDFGGAYAQIVVFLEHLSKIQKIVRVEEISLAPKGSQSAQFVDLSGTMNLLVYRYVGSKADEVITRKPGA